MRVLQLSHKPPYPPIDGGSIAINNITMGLADMIDVDFKLISINTPKHYVSKESLPGSYVSKSNIQLIDVDTSIKPLSALFNLFSGKSYHMSRFYSKSFEYSLIKELEIVDYDIILFESIFLSEYLPIIRKHTKAKLVLRSHNIEYLIWKRIAIKETNILKKKYLSILANRLENEELNQVSNYDAMICVSEKDEQFFKKNGFANPSTTIPIGIDVTKSLDFDENEIHYPNLFMLGALDWMPNQEGIVWFLEEVWPRLIKDFPSLKLNVAGRRPPASILAIKEKGVSIHGEIDDAAKFIKENAIMLVPLFSGSGMRVKIIEGMMLGKVIVSTSIGAEGIPCNHNENILIADDQDSFYNAIKSVILDRPKFDEISSNALLFSSSNYSQKYLTERLHSFLKNLT